MKKDCTSPTQGSHDILTFRADRPPMFRLPQIRCS